VKQMKNQKLPKGWDEARIKEVLSHYEKQSDSEALKEDEAAYKASGLSMIEVPDELIPKVRRLIVAHASK
jgi:hypothetical protein